MTRSPEVLLKCCFDFGFFLECLAGFSSEREELSFELALTTLSPRLPSLSSEASTILDKQTPNKECVIEGYLSTMAIKRADLGRTSDPAVTERGVYGHVMTEDPCDPGLCITTMAIKERLMLFEQGGIK